MASIIETVELAVPVQTAYNQWTQFEAFPQFMRGVEDVKQLDETHLHWQVNVAGARREFDTEITEQHPDERVAWRSTTGITHAGVVTFHRLDDTHSRVTAQIKWEPAGVIEHAGSAIGSDDRQVRADLKRFKQFIEARGHPTGGWRGNVSPYPGPRGDA